VKRVPVGPNCEGMYVARHVYDQANGQSILLRQGALLTSALIQRMERRGIEGVWVSDELIPDIENSEVIQHETREKSKAVIREVFRAFAGKKGDAIPQVHALMQSVRQIVDDILGNEDVLMNIGQLRAFDDYTFGHSIQVATISIIIGREMGLQRDQLERLGTGAILHDIGKVTIPKDVLNKQGELAPEELELIRGHARTGWEMVHENYLIMPTSSIVILEHHERIDGSGYPDGKRGEEIYEFSRMVAVADVFDAMRSNRTYRKRLKPAQILNNMKKDAGTRLDRRMVEILLRRISLAAQGEIVRLSDGTYGMVREEDVIGHLQPRVCVVTDDAGRLVQRYEENLKGTSVYVLDVLDDWPPEILMQLKERRMEVAI